MWTAQIQGFHVVFKYALGEFYKDLWLDRVEEGVLSSQVQQRREPGLRRRYSRAEVLRDGLYEDQEKRSCGEMACGGSLKG